VRLLRPHSGVRVADIIFLVAPSGRIGRYFNMAVIAIMMVAATALAYAASMLRYRGYDWADTTCSNLPDACASPHYLAIATVIVIGIFFVKQAINKSK